MANALIRAGRRLADRNLHRAVICLGGALLLNQQGVEYIGRWLRERRYQPNPYAAAAAAVTSGFGCTLPHEPPMPTFATFQARELATDTRYTYDFIGNSWRFVRADGTHWGAFTDADLESKYADPEFWVIERRV